MSCVKGGILRDLLVMFACHGLCREAAVGGQFFNSFILAQVCQETKDDYVYCLSCQ
jgi:hypothetical protein